MRFRKSLWLFGGVLLAIGLARLRFDVEVLNLLPSQIPEVRALKLYQENFSNARELVISIQAADREKTEDAARNLAETLRAMPELFTNVTWQPPWLENPAQAAELIAHIWFNQPPPVFAKLIDRLTGTHAAATLADSRERLSTSFSPAELTQLSYDPFQLMNLPERLDQAGSGFEADQGPFESREGTFRLIFAESAADLNNYRTCAVWLQRVKEQIDAWRASRDVSRNVIFRFTGRPAFMAEIGGSMETDLRRSAGGTAIIIILLFWFAHRSWRPLLWLMVLMGAILLTTFSIGGLIFRDLNVVSAGFAAILLGLAVDYALVLYQEHRTSPSDSLGDLKRKLGPSIFWSAATTAGAFLVLNWGGLPGLGQLGSLVAAGTCVAGLVMFHFFLQPIIGREERIPRTSGKTSAISKGLLRPLILWPVTVMVFALSLLALFQHGVRLDASSQALRLRESGAHAALDEIKIRMNQPQDPLGLVIAGRDETEVAGRLDAASHVLSRAQSNGEIEAHTLPTSVWPRPENQRVNRISLKKLLPNQGALLGTALESGFTSNSLALTHSIFQAWHEAAAETNVFWPKNRMSRWVMGKLTARSPDQVLALGLVYPPPSRSEANGRPATATHDAYTIGKWADELPDQGVWLAGWSQLGTAVLGVVMRDLKKVLLPMIGLLLVSLWLAFRRVTEVFLSIATLAFSGFALTAFMAVAGWSWNLLNLMAIPLLLGAGVDYSIHIQLGLRRHAGDVSKTQRSVGRALLLCGATTFAGFSSLAWSSNAGLASLGQVCAAGIAITTFVSVFFLPGWWTSLAERGTRQSSAGQIPPPPGSMPGTNSSPVARGTSSLYRADLWRIGQLAGRSLPPRFADRIGRAFADVYWRVNRKRREVVIQNLLPAVCGDRAKAALASRGMFRQFAGKLVDLWRYENGLPIDDMIRQWTGWKHFVRAQARGRGVLLVTPHLGNWEFGAPLLVKKGVPPLVVTLVEPDAGLTELRQAARARWGIETLVIGDNPFSFIEVIRRLETGSTVALLIDRPPDSSAVTVELFGSPFSGSIAPAELARASGCAVLPVYLPKSADGYTAHILPELNYDRKSLGTRTGRIQFTQEIIRVFEPIIREHIDQWYHFIPVWRG